MRHMARVHILTGTRSAAYVWGFRMLPLSNAFIDSCTSVPVFAELTHRLVAMVSPGTETPESTVTPLPPIKTSVNNSFRLLYFSQTISILPEMQIPNQVRDLTGQKFNFLTVIEYAGQNKHRMAMWVAQCECGKTVTLTRGNLVSGNTKSCGCKWVELHTTHGHKKTGTGNGYRGSRTYFCWQSMKARCLNEKKAEFQHYGGRGIKVCERWMTFEMFLEDMGEVPDGMSLDREDNELGYSKENCRWATKQEQQGNRRTSRRLTINGVTKHMAEWARHFGLSDDVVGRRLRSGWPEHLIFSPLGSKLKTLLSVQTETK